MVELTSPKWRFLFLKHKKLKIGYNKKKNKLPRVAIIEMYAISPFKNSTLKIVIKFKKERKSTFNYLQCNAMTLSLPNQPKQYWVWDSQLTIKYKFDFTPFEVTIYF